MTSESVQQLTSTHDVPMQSPWDNLQKFGDLGEIWAHDVAEKMYLNRAAAAMGYGLNPHAVSKHEPARRNSERVETTREIHRDTGWLKGAIAALLAAVLFGGTGMWLGGAFRPNAPEPAEPRVEIRDQVWDYRVESEVIPPENPAD